MSEAAVDTVESTANETAQPISKPAGGDKEAPHYHVNEFKTGKRDEFTAAFNSAQDELRGEADEDDEELEPQPKPKAKKAEEPEAKPKKEPEKKEKAESKAEPEGADAEAETQEAAAKDEEKPAAEENKEEPKAKAPLEARRWWSSRKRDAFARMPQHIKEAWLAEPPAPDQRWTEEQKVAFAKLPVEGQEILLERSQEIERGYGEKFESLANERKLAEEIKKSVPPQFRSIMDQRGLTEPQVFQKLAQQQLHAWGDPKGYIAKFIADAKINPADLFDVDGQGYLVLKSQAQQQPQNQAAQDIRAHPEFQAMAARQRDLEAQLQETQKSEDERFTAELDGLLKETDGEGNSLYPFINLLIEPMATILESDPDRFSGLSTRDRLAAAYCAALEDFPELTAIQMAAPKPKVDEPEEKKADPDEGERVARLEKAVTPKSRSPQTTPDSSAAGDPFEKAWASAKKQLGKR